MAIKKKETAEQKLLKMIEDSSGADVSVSKTKQKVAKKQNTLSLMKVANKVLIVGVLGSIVFLGNEIISGAALTSKAIEVPAGKKAKVLGDGDSQGVTIQRLSYYLANVNRRNIFQPFEEAQKALEVTDKNKKIANALTKYKLVGVSWLDKIDTASVMIEDTDKKVTYFLHKGEKIGDIVVKTIYADSALLGYEDEEIIIKYDKSKM